jgi:hypothetical protein
MMAVMWTMSFEVMEMQWVAALSLLGTLRSVRGSLSILSLLF